MAVPVSVNGQMHSTPASADTPLLYVLRNDLGLNGPKFGCGVAQCGTCTVMLDGKAVHACVTPLADVGARKVLTIEGLAQGGKLHALQQAFIDEQAAQCGYCANGMIMTAKAFLDRNPRPSEAQVRKALTANFCRCGTHNRIVRAILRASRVLAGTTGRTAVAEREARA